LIGFLIKGRGEGLIAFSVTFIVGSVCEWLVLDVRFPAYLVFVMLRFMGKDLHERAHHSEQQDRVT
jgi:hypothetical protein